VCFWKILVSDERGVPDDRIERALKRHVLRPASRAEPTKRVTSDDRHRVSATTGSLGSFIGKEFDRSDLPLRPQPLGNGLDELAISATRFENSRVRFDDGPVC
jgi:hypothetical protein